eukprot:1653674-Rhodomonas_salina.2
MSITTICAATGPDPVNPLLRRLCGVAAMCGGEKGERGGGAEGTWRICSGIVMLATAFSTST